MCGVVREMVGGGGMVSFGKILVHSSSITYVIVDIYTAAFFITKEIFGAVSQAAF